MGIEGNYLVEKLNTLNELRSNNLTLQELRFFSIYLAKINARDVSTRVVRFSIDDFQKIMELSQVKIRYLTEVTDSLLCKVVRIPLDSNTLESFQLFKECRIGRDEKGKRYIEIDAHDKALPLMFEFKERYFTYQLWNALKLKSSNQLRMYEILKQYERIGERVISISGLKDLLGLEQSDYLRYGNFKAWVLDVCQKALEENTDIKFTYEPYGERGRGGKILRLKFAISKNTGYKDPLSLDEFIGQQEIDDIVMCDEEGGSRYFEREAYPMLASACEKEFCLEEIRVLYNMIVEIIPYRSTGVPGYMVEVYKYLERRYDEMNWQAGRREIWNRFGYLKKIIESDLVD